MFRQKASFSDEKYVKKQKNSPNRCRWFHRLPSHRDARKVLQKNGYDRSKQESSIKNNVQYK